MAVTKEPTPFQRLTTCLVLIRGGKCSETQLGWDVLEWMVGNGPATKENVEQWIEGSFELKFALDVQINREPRG